MTGSTVHTAPVSEPTTTKQTVSAFHIVTTCINLLHYIPWTPRCTCLMQSVTTWQDIASTINHRWLIDRLHSTPTHTPLYCAALCTCQQQSIVDFVLHESTRQAMKLDHRWLAQHRHFTSLSSSITSPKLSYLCTFLNKTYKRIDLRTSWKYIQPIFLVRYLTVRLTLLISLCRNCIDSYVRSYISFY